MHRFIGILLLFITLIFASSETNTSALKTSDYKIYTAFYHFNPDIKKKTIKHFFEITEKLELDTNREILFDLALQICLESNAKHKIGGKINTSKSNALGIGQLKTGTCFDIFRTLTTEEHMLLKQIDKKADFLWAIKHRSFDKSAENEAKKWLEDEELNLISWGLLMRRYLIKYGNLCDSFMAYEQGETGRIHLIQMGTSCSEMKYFDLHNSKKEEVLDLIQSRTSLQGD